MPRNRRGVIATGCAVCLGLIAVGCQSTRSTSSKGAYPSSPAYTAYTSGAVNPGPSTVLRPGSVVAWSVASEQSNLRQPVTKQVTVASDGSLALEAYGSVSVSGQSVDQARATVERYLATYLKDPQVSLRLVSGGATASADTDGWHTAGTKSKTVVATSYQSGTSQYEPAAYIGPIRGSSRAQAPSDLKAENTDSDPPLVPAPTPVDTSRLHPEPVVGAPVFGHGSPAPHELGKVNLPPYVIEPPDILLIEASPEKKLDQPIAGQHLVRPDGTVNLGYNGSVRVSGLTLDEAREAVYRHLLDRLKEADPGNDLKPNKVNVDVIAYNSKVFYVVMDGAGYGEQVIRIPVTGNETVLDALGQLNGLPPMASKRHIWVARRTPGDGIGNQILPVDWIGITQHGATATNYQVMPGDRIYVMSDKLIRFNNQFNKILAPINSGFGATLLGSTTVHSVQGRTSSTTP